MYVMSFDVMLFMEFVLVLLPFVRPAHLFMLVRACVLLACDYVVESRYLISSYLTLGMYVSET